MTATKTIDLPEVRQNLVRLAGVQAVLLLGILLAWRFLGGLDARFTLWLAVLPVLVALWSAFYYRTLRQAAEAGGEKTRYVAANKRALGALGLAGLVWVAGFVALLIASW